MPRHARGRRQWQRAALGSRHAACHGIVVAQQRQVGTVQKRRRPLRMVGQVACRGEAAWVSSSIHQHHGRPRITPASGGARAGAAHWTICGGNPRDVWCRQRERGGRRVGLCGMGCGLPASGSGGEAPAC
jgi:hypothetical protein